MSIQVNCPRCGALASPGSYCQSCGTPVASVVQPTLWSRFGIAPNQRVARESAELAGKTRQAAHLLLGVSILQSAIALILACMVIDKPHKWSDAAPELLGQCLVSSLYYGLFFWARISPLPATIVGFVLHLTFMVISVVIHVAIISKGNVPVSGIGVGWLDFVVLAGLGGGIGAAVRQRRLLRVRG